MTQHNRRTFLSFAAFFAASSFSVMLSGCGDNKPSAGGDTGAGTTPAGSDTNGGGGKGEANPKKLVFGFVPSVEADKVAKDAQPMADFLTKELGIPVTTYTSTEYAGLIEAMGSGKVDIGSLTPLGYVLAKDKNYAEVLLKTKRRGSLTYHGMFIARADSGIKKIEDAKGKRMAWVDSGSTSGYLFPATYLKVKGLDPETFFEQTTFAGSHDGAVRAVYNGDVDVAAVYDDARNKVEAELPDVKTKVVKIGQTDEIPNDTISVRPTLDPALVAKIKAALLKYAETPEGKKTLLTVYEVDGMVEAKDADYDPVRVVAKNMDYQIASLDKPKKAAPAASASPGAPPSGSAASPSATPSASPTAAAKK